MQAAYGAGVVVLSGTLILAACGGGGGGGTIPGGTAVQTTPFTSWRDNVAGKVIEAKGFGREIGYTYDCPDTSNCKDTGRVTGISSKTSTSVSALFFFNDSGNLTQFWPTSSVGFSGTLGRPNVAAWKSAPLVNFVAGTSATAQAIVSDPKSQAWSYQSFGVWESGLNSFDAGTYGVMSVGAPTAGSAVPTTGSATFKGNVVGAYVDSTGQGHAVLADLTVDANFDNQTLKLSTANTQVSTNWTTFTSNTSLNLSGTLTYTPGTNTFAGTLSTGTLSGTSSGTFYGPTAQELGGVFDLSKSGSLETYAGAYGAKQTTP